MRFLTLGKRMALLGVVLLLAGPLGTRLGLLSFVVGFACFAHERDVRSAGTGALTRGRLPHRAVEAGRRAWSARPCRCWRCRRCRSSRAVGAPPIHDITTDTADPPAFVAALPLRAAANAANPPEYGGAEVAAQQHRAFPDLQPLVMTVPPHRLSIACWPRCSALGMGDLGRGAGRGSHRGGGHHHVLRLQGRRGDPPAAVEGGTRVDVRSKSRVGLGDTGTNAMRIRRLLSASTRRPLSGRRCRRAGRARRPATRGRATGHRSSPARRTGSTRPSTS